MEYRKIPSGISSQSHVAHAMKSSPSTMRAAASSRATRLRANRMRPHSSATHWLQVISMPNELRSGARTHASRSRWRPGRIRRCCSPRGTASTSPTPTDTMSRASTSGTVRSCVATTSGSRRACRRDKRRRGWRFRPTHERSSTPSRASTMSRSSTSQAARSSAEFRRAGIRRRSSCVLRRRRIKMRAQTATLHRKCERLRLAARSRRRMEWDVHRHRPARRRRSIALCRMGGDRGAQRALRKRRRGRPRTGTS